MTPEQKAALKAFAEAIDDLARVMAQNARAVGIEWSASDAQDVIRDAFKDAQKAVITATFVNLFTSNL